MSEPDTIIREEAAPRSPLTSVTFRKSCAVQDRAGHKTVFGRGETAGFPADVAADLLQRHMAVQPGAPLDPAPPDQTPTAIKFLRGDHTGRQCFGEGERAVVPKVEAEALSARGAVIPDDGCDVLIAADPQTHRLQSRVLARGRQLAEQVLERYR